jgi:hypothetical protein
MKDLKLTIKAADDITGGFSKPSKLNAPAISISAFDCITGSLLRLREGSVCAKCYAHEGFYKVFADTVRPAQDRRKAALDRAVKDLDFRAVYVAAFVKLLRKSTRFRWFDAGDCQGVGYVDIMVAIATAAPHVQFWIPTKEPRFYKRWESINGRQLPNNIVLRVSAPMIDQRPVKVPAHWNTSTVTSDKSGSDLCPAYSNGGKCGPCVRCYDRAESNIAYPLH